MALVGSPGVGNESAADCAQPPRCTLRQLVAYFLRLGAVGFGGPVALVGYMHRDLVEKRGWISEADYKDGLALAQLAPGPLAAQLAMYLGYVHYRILSATLAGVAFVLPSFLIVLVLGWAYVRYQGLSWMQSIFYDVGAAVIGIIAISAYKLTRKSIGHRRVLWVFYFAAAVYTVVTESESTWIFLVAGVLAWLTYAGPGRLWPDSVTASLIPPPLLIGALSAADWGLLAKIAWFFTLAGAFVFSSGLAIVPFLYGGVVHEYKWLDERQFMDAVAGAMITPGPVVITVAFIGYLVAGLPGACVAALATFRDRVGSSLCLRLGDRNHRAGHVGNPLAIQATGAGPRGGGRSGWADRSSPGALVK